MTVNEDELDRAIAGLIDAAPSRDLRAHVMQRIAGAHGKVRRSEGPVFARRASTEARKLRRSIVFATIVIVLVAASAWFTRKPVEIRLKPDPTSAGGQVRLKPDHASAATTSAATADSGRATRTAARPRRPLAQPVATEPADDVASTMPPLEMPPLADPPPVAMTPLVTSPIEIPAIEIRPLDEPGEVVNSPFKPDPDKKQPGGGSGTVR